MEKRNRITKLIIIIINIVILTGLMIVQYRTNPDKGSTVKIGKERINIFYSDDTSYLFLPSYVNSIEIMDNVSVKIIDPVIMQSANLPTIFIDTKSGNMDDIYADKHYKETGKVRIYDKNGKLDYSGGLKRIQGRGNYSWTNWDKKSYTISLTGDKSLLGLNSGVRYALVANASDPTLIRNEIARRMEQAVGMEDTTIGEYADLYINGDYMGNYYLCPTIAINKDRVNIHDLEQEMNRMYSKTDYSGFDVYETPLIKGWNLQQEPEDITGGYILEREFGERYNLEYSDNKSGLITDRGESFVIKSPEYCSKNQIIYLSEYMNEVENTINSPDFTNATTGKSINDYIDIESFAKWYLVGEVTKNYDAGVSSAFFYKDSDTVDGRLKLASGWDYDMSLGNYLDWMEYYNQDAGGLTRLNSVESSSDWYEKLYNNDEYRNIVIENYYTCVIPYINELLESGITEYQERLLASTQMDAVRWNAMYTEKGYMVGDSAAYNELASFIEARMAYLSSVWDEIK